MSSILIREVHSRSPLMVRRVPFLARFYRYAFQQQASRKRELLVHVPLQKLFRLCRRMARFPHWGEFRYERLGQPTTVRFDARNLQFQTLYSGIWDRGYEQDVSALLDIVLPEGGTLYDIGSNWGFCSLHAASNRSRLNIHAFEPHPRTFQDLVSCVQQAGLADLVTCHNVALSNQDKQAFIDLPDGLHSGSAELNLRGRGVRVQTRRLDSMELPSPDAIKVDVEGHELEVLEGGRRVLESARPFLMMESKRHYGSAATTLEPLRYLAGLGYELYVPAVKRQVGGADYFVPYGVMLETGHIQWIELADCLALIPCEPATRFLLQTDINVFACHLSRKGQLLTEFREWR